MKFHFTVLLLSRYERLHASRKQDQFQDCGIIAECGCGAARSLQGKLIDEMRGELLPQRLKPLVRAHLIAALRALRHPKAALLLRNRRRRIDGITKLRIVNTEFRS